MTKEDVQKRVLKDGKLLALDKFSWDEKTLTFSSAENGLVLDFSDVKRVTFKTTDHCTFKTGYDCTFNTGYYCTFDTGSDCTFDTRFNCTFKTYDNCTFKTGENCTFDTDYDCTFDTRFNCTFKTYENCAFDTGSYCTFDTADNCTLKTGEECVIVRRDRFEVIQPEAGKTIQTCPHEIPGYLVDGKLDGVPHIIADGILSRVIKQKGNVYKVINHWEENESWLIRDGDDWSHGATIDDARNSLMYKRKDRDTSAYEGMTLNTEYTLAEAVKMYRTVTGACAGGVKSFVKSQEAVKDSYTVADILKLTEGKYGHESLKAFVKGAEV